MPATSTYTFGTRLAGPIASTRPRVEAALKQEGFGVLTEIDVRATLAAKLGVEWPPHVILGACNPPLAHRALQADPSVGALLPCNVVLREESGDTVVEVMDPLSALGIVDHPGIEPVATEARERLERALRALEVPA
jgi:uncharacterized protein (DUF302 family)